MRLKLSALIILFFLATLTGNAQKDTIPYRKYFVGSTFFVLGNLIQDDNPPGFAQINIGYRVTPKNVVSAEIKTWKYAWPLGIPYGNSFQAPEERYPGHVREYGIALVYQRFWWKGVYTSIHAMSALQRFVDRDKKKIQNGYQLFMTYRLGYHIQLFKNRFFIEPSIAMTHWPVKANTPASFSEKEKKWSNTFFPEPGLHFGIKF